MTPRIWTQITTGHLGNDLPASVRRLGGLRHPFYDVTNKPINTVLTAPAGKFAGDEGVTPPMVDTAKPPFQPLMMATINNTKPEFDMVGTFSGCGGSSLGFRLAGFKPLLVNEFDPIAVDTYRLNQPDTPIDERSITVVTADEILDQIGKQPGELDFLEGSPPCSNFSLAGKRAKGWNTISRADSDIEQANVEDLFFEWIRLVAGIKPKTFCAENVIGLKAGVAKGYFKRIVYDLRALDYNVAVYQIDAQWCGVPQARRRLFFTGIRNDLPVAKILPPTPLPYRYTVLDALPHLANRTTWHAWHGPNNNHHNETAWDGTPRQITINELKRLSSFPDDFQLTGTYQEQWGRIGNAVPPLLAAAIGHQMREALQQCRT